MPALVLVSINLHTKCEVPSYTRSKDIMRPHIWKWVTWLWPRPYVILTLDIQYRYNTNLYSIQDCVQITGAANIACLCAKFDDSSSPIPQMIGAPKFNTSHVIMSTTLSGWLVIHRLELAMISLPPPIMKTGKVMQKVEKWSGFG